MSLLIFRHSEKFEARGSLSEKKEQKKSLKKQREDLSKTILEGTSSPNTITEVKKRLNTNESSRPFIKLRDSGYGWREIEEIMLLEGLYVKERLVYFEKLSRATGLKDRNLSNGGGIEIQWFKTEKDADKACKYINTLKKTGLYSRTYGGYELYRRGIREVNLEARQEDIKIIIDRGRLVSEIRKKIPNKAKYKRFAESLREYNANTQSFTVIEACYILGNFNDLNNFIEFLVEARIPNLKKAAILWVSKGGQTPNEQEIGVARIDRGKTSILNGDPKEAMRFIKEIEFKIRTYHPRNLQGTIRKLWRYTHDPEEAMYVYEFEKKYNFGLLDENSSWKIGKKTEVLREIDNLCGNSAESIEFCRHIFDNTTRIDQKNVESFLKDPALPICIMVYKTMKSGRTTVPTNIETALIIGRNIYFKHRKNLRYYYEQLRNKNYLEFGLPSDIEDGYSMIEHMREKYENVYVFKGKTVLFLGNSERWGRKNKKRFTSKKILEGVKDSIGGKDADKKLKLFEAKDNASERNLKDVKRQVLYWIENVNEPITFVFNGHGGEDKLYFHNNESSNAYISAREMADSMIKRSKKMGREITSQDIFMINACYSNNFMRNVYEILHDEEAYQGLIAITEAEYGQYGFTKGEKEDSLFEVIGIGKKDIKIKDVMKKEKEYRGSDASIFVYDFWRPNQISKKNNSKNKAKV